MTRQLTRIVLALAFLTCLTAAVASAQAPTTTTETKKFEVIAVEGNQLVVRLPEGTKELTVPEDFRFNVDGQMLSVHDLKPGMAGTATITTKTTLKPVTVTEVKNGEVIKVTGSTILVLTPDGYRNFSEGELEKRGVRIMKDGKPVVLSDLHTGDKLSAVIITSMPPQRLTEQQVNATLATGGGASGSTTGTKAGSATGTAGAATGTKTAAPAAEPAAPSAAAAPRKLPKTASPLPLFALVGAGSLLTGIGLTMRRRRQTR
jgi:LPXTG-motif cell wall-anchored protein